MSEIKHYSKDTLHVKTQSGGMKLAKEVLNWRLESKEPILRNPLGYPVGYIKRNGWHKVGLIIGSGRKEWLVES